MDQACVVPGVPADCAQELARHRMLTRAEEAELGTRALAGNREAQEALVVHNGRFVHTIARRHRGGGVGMEVLIGAGTTGLAKAAERWDPATGVRFIAFAVAAIAREIQREIDTARGAVRMSRARGI